MGRRLVALVLTFSAVAGCGRLAVRPTKSEGARLDPADARMGALLGRRCAGCHGPDAPAASVRYDSLDAAREGARAAALQLAARTMPPPTVRQPTDTERREMLAWLEAAFDR